MDQKGHARRYLSNTWNRTTTKWATSSESVANIFCSSSGAMITYLVRHLKSKPKFQSKQWSEARTHLSRLLKNQGRGELTIITIIFFKKQQVSVRQAYNNPFRLLLRFNIARFLFELHILKMKPPFRYLFESHIYFMHYSWL